MADIPIKYLGNMLTAAFQYSFCPEEISGATFESTIENVFDINNNNIYDDKINVRKNESRFILKNGAINTEGAHRKLDAISDADNFPDIFQDKLKFSGLESKVNFEVLSDEPTRRTNILRLSPLPDSSRNIANQPQPLMLAPTHATSPMKPDLLSEVAILDRADMPPVIKERINGTITPGPASDQEEKELAGLPIDDRSAGGSVPIYPVIDQRVEHSDTEVAVANRCDVTSFNAVPVQGIGHWVSLSPPVTPPASAGTRPGRESDTQPASLALTAVGDYTYESLPATLHGRGGPVQTPNASWDSEVVVDADPGARHEKAPVENVMPGLRARLDDLPLRPTAQANEVTPNRQQIDWPTVGRAIPGQTKDNRDVYGPEAGNWPLSDLPSHAMAGRTPPIPAQKSPSVPIVEMIGQGAKKHAAVAATPALSMATIPMTPSIAIGKVQDAESRTLPMPGGRLNLKSDYVMIGNPALGKVGHSSIVVGPTPSIASPSMEATKADDRAALDAPRAITPDPGLYPVLSTPLINRTLDPHASAGQRHTIEDTTLPVASDLNLAANADAISTPVSSHSDIDPATQKFQLVHPTEHHGPNRPPESATRMPSSETIAAATYMPQLAQAISALHQSADGSRHIKLNLRPDSLGRVEVTITSSVSGGDRIEIAVTRPETLALLRADTTALHQALDTAGLTPTQRDIALLLAPPEGTSIERGMSTFDRPSSGGGSQQSFSGHGGHAAPEAGNRTVSATDGSIPLATHFARSSTGLDITA